MARVPPAARVLRRLPLVVVRFPVAVLGIPYLTGVDVADCITACKAAAAVRYKVGRHSPHQRMRRRGGTERFVRRLTRALW